MTKTNLLVCLPLVSLCPLLNAATIRLSGNAVFSSPDGSPAFGFDSTTTAQWSIIYSDSAPQTGSGGSSDYFVPTHFTFSTGDHNWTAAAMLGTQPSISVVDRSVGRDLINFAFDATTNGNVNISPFGGTSAFFTVRFQGNGLLSSSALSGIAAADFNAADTMFIYQGDRSGNSVFFDVTQIGVQNIPEPSGVGLLFAGMLPLFSCYRRRVL